MASDDVSVDELKQLEIKDEDEVTPGYKAPAKVDLKTIQNLDADDESLQKYKKELLGAAENVLDEGGNNVLVKTLRVQVEGRDDIVLDLTGDLKKLKPVGLKEGTPYKLNILFRVQREIVSGLRLYNVISRKGVTVDKLSYMVGSYGPKTEEHSFVTSTEEAPKGMIARGSYTVKSKFTDDDKNVILQWEWTLNITKDWK